jgi:hypothetical protein
MTDAADEVTATSDLTKTMRNARERGLRWLGERFDDQGRPEGATVANVWWRAPWTLCVAGAPDLAAAVMGWIEREALQDDGDLRPGPYTLAPPQSPAYFLSPIAIAAWMLGRYGTATAINDRLRSLQDPVTGGVYEYLDHGEDNLEDLLKTAQVGISALATGDRATADGVFHWVATHYFEQPDLPRRLFTARRDGAVVTTFPESEAFLRVVDFHAPRQTYFNPGIAAAFLAGYYLQTGVSDALPLARDYLTLNTSGSDIQWTDPTSVQICKFGWGAAAMTVADRSGRHRGDAERMARWFCDRQRPDGAWAPSSFGSNVEPSTADLFWKSAEHLLELCFVEQALAGAAPV